MINKKMEIQKQTELEIQFCEKCGWIGDGQTRIQNEEQAYFEICPDCKAKAIWIKR